MIDPRTDRDNDWHPGDGSVFVEVLFARDVQEASRQCQLLNEFAIPARIEPESGRSDMCGVAVLIPPDRLIAASQILTQMVPYGPDEDFIANPNEDDLPPPNADYGYQDSDFAPDDAEDVDIHVDLGEYLNHFDTNHDLNEDGEGI